MEQELLFFQKAVSYTHLDVYKRQMQDMMRSLDPPSSKGKKKIVVMDAGISVGENLKWLRENGYDYITVRRGGSTDNYKIVGDHTVTVEDVRHQRIEIQFAEIENVNDTLLLVDSHAKTLKEKSMHGKASNRFEEGLKAIQKGIITKGGTKKRDKVNERLGRFKAVSYTHLRILKSFFVKYERKIPELLDEDVYKRQGYRRL